MTRKQPFDDDRLFGAKAFITRSQPISSGEIQFEILMQYTKNAVDAIRAGDMIAAESYARVDNATKAYTVLSITSIEPKHFAAQGRDAYPGHVFESMHGIYDEMTSQTDEPRFHTTTITMTAVSTGFQFKFGPGQAELPSLERDALPPIVGASVRPLSANMVEHIVNQGIKEFKSFLHHKEFKTVSVRLDFEKMLTTHTGIFGFTGVGKSNLVSSYLTTLLHDEITNVSTIVIDPNDEYVGLLLDVAKNHPDRFHYLLAGRGGMADPIVKAFGTPADEVPPATAKLLIDQMHLPGALEYHKDSSPFAEYLRDAAGHVIERAAMLVSNMDIAQWLHLEANQMASEGTALDTRRAIDRALRRAVTNPGPMSLKSLVALQKVMGDQNHPQNPFNFIDTLPLGDSKRGTAKGIIGAVKDSIRLEIGERQAIRNFPQVTIADIVAAMNKKNGDSKIYIVVGHDDSKVKRTIAETIDQLGQTRRESACREPYAHVLIDEADLYVPLKSEGEATDEIKEKCTWIARRGRKFGVGLTIATQRATHLDTGIMGNLHTYFISKLPRSEDRRRVADAFGIGEDHFVPTFSFSPGDWLIISHDATGIQSTPIPTHAVNANRRILEDAGIDAD